ncbi:hypothetical protein LZ30DRAFT_753558 [Colletotrichum cereale]|nr:hypothetical protein LZ30DRAFT_753558 [Colletotrichum cereale]
MKFSKRLNLTVLLPKGKGVELHTRVRKPAPPTSRSARQPRPANELETWSGLACPKVIYVFCPPAFTYTPRNMCRSEPENLGNQGSAPLRSGRKASAIPYSVDLESNFLRESTSRAAVDGARRLLTLASTRCPYLARLDGQGTVVMASAISGLGPTIQNQTKLVVLFGYTEDLSKMSLYCDAMYFGTLFILPSDFLYHVRAVVSAPHFSAACIR